MTANELKHELQQIQNKCNPTSPIWMLIELMLKVADQFYPPELANYEISKVR